MVLVSLPVQLDIVLLLYKDSYHFFQVLTNCLMTAGYFSFLQYFYISRYFRIVEVCARSKSSSREDVVVVMSRFWLGDWFIMMQLCRNMHPEIFHNIVIDLRNKIDPKLSENMEESKVTTRMVKQKMQFVDIP